MLCADFKCYSGWLTARRAVMGRITREPNAALSYGNSAAGFRDRSALRRNGSPHNSKRHQEETDGKCE